MTVPATARRAGPYNGNGSTTSFSFSFKTFAAGDLLVTKMDTLGVETTLVLNSDYSVTLNSDQDTSPGGTITYPISGSPLPTGHKLTIVGDLEYEQTTDLLGGGAFNARVIEDTFDRTVIQIQQLEERIDRALLVPVNSTANAQLPNPEPSEVIGWNSAGTALQNYALSQLATGIAYGTTRYDTFTGNGSTTQFALSEDPAALANLDVSIAGVTQVPGADYTLTSATLVFTSAPPNGAVILARYGRALPVSGPVDASAVTYQPAGPGAKARTAQSKLREAVSVFDFMTPEQIADVQAGTALLDVSSAIITAIASFPNTHSNIYYDQAGTLYFPPGKYYCGQTIYINRTIHLLGANSGQIGNAVSASWIEFAHNINGFVFNHWNSTPAVAPNKSANGSVLENLTVTQKLVVGRTIGSGALIKARVTIRDCTFFYWAQNGISIDASAGSGGATEGNANIFKIDSCTCAYNLGSGLAIGTVAGADSNAGTIINLNATGNGVYGIWESSFLGNTYIGCHTAANVSGGYYLDANNNNRSVFVGCYSEADEPGSVINSLNTYWIGGLQGPGVTGTTKLLGDNIVNLGSTQVLINAQATSPARLSVNEHLTGSGFNPIEFVMVRASAGGSGNRRPGIAFVDEYYDNAGRVPPAVYSAYAGLGFGIESGSTDVYQRKTRIRVRGGNVNGFEVDFSSDKGATYSNKLTLQDDGHFRPGADDAQSNGTVTHRWSVIYAGNGTIQTSDGREKEQTRNLSDAERAVAVRLKSLIRAFKFSSAVQKKGDLARVHVGVIAQDVAEAFAAEGLRAEDYGVFCYDKWNDQYEDRFDENGELVERKLIYKAGDRYGVRYDQLFAFVIAAL